MEKIKVKHNVGILLIAISAVFLFSVSPAFAQPFGWKASATVPAGINPDDAHFIFMGTGGTISNAKVKWDAKKSTAPAPATIGTPDDGNGGHPDSNQVDIVWAAPLNPGAVVAFTFSTTDPSGAVTSGGGNWTVNGANVGQAIQPKDVDFGVHPVPTVSEWGVAVMALLVLLAGTIVVKRQRRIAAV